MIDLERTCALAHVLLVQARVEPTPVREDEEFRRRREAHQLLMNSEVPLAVFEGAAHTQALVNDAWQALLGSASVAREALDAVFATGTVRIVELAFTVDGGREITCRAAFAPLRGPDGATTGVVVACVDATDEVVAQRLDVGPLALAWSGSVDAGPDYYNRRWRDYTGGAMPWQSAVHPDDLPRCMQAFAEAARQRVSTDIEVRLAGADAGYRWHRVRFTMLGVAGRWFGTATDIDYARAAAAERGELVGRERTARADAEQANRLKDQFLAAVSHELRAPLTTMLLWEKVLRDDTTDAAHHVAALDAIHQSAVAQSRLVADLLDVSRAISGKLFVDLRPLDIGGIVRDAVTAAGELAAAKRIELACHVAPDIAEVMGDGHRLRQVLDNLISNALKFSEPGCRVELAAERVGRSVVVAVVDNGRGITPEFLPHLFEPFRQTDDALTREQGGLGLGLSIAYQLVALHHGTLAATSAGRGRGARFTMTLPALEPSAEPRPASGNAAPATSDLDGVRVLIVDDDRRVREALGLLLERSGAIVETAESAASARVRLARNVPDALVCDIAMPGEDGYSFLRTIRGASTSIREIPAIAVTAHASSADDERARVSGFDRHLPKPIDVEVLIASIRELVAARRHDP